MAGYNKVILVGNLTRDPQMSYLPSQTPVTELGLAVNRRWRGQDGQQREEVCFVDCRAYGRSAETLNQYMKKGNPILIEGRLQFDQWEGKDGQRRSKHRVIVERFQFLGGGTPGAGGGDYQRSRPPAPQAPQAPEAPQAPQGPPAPEAPQAQDSYPEDFPPAPEGQPGENIPF